MSGFGVSGSFTKKKRKIVQTLFNTAEKINKYTEANDISTPTELLAEFLFSIMIKDYEKALDYCTQILTFEPNNSTVRRFYPLIMEKLEMKVECSSSESSGSNSSDSSQFSENDSSLNKIIKKSSQESNKTGSSSEDESIEEINDYLGSSLNISEGKTKSTNTRTEKDRKIVSQFLKERQ